MGRRRGIGQEEHGSRQDRSAVGNHAGTGILDGQRRLVIGVDAHATGTKDHIHALSQHILDSRRNGRRVIGQGRVHGHDGPVFSQLAFDDRRKRIFNAAVKDFITRRDDAGLF